MVQKQKKIKFFDTHTKSNAIAERINNDDADCVFFF